MIYAIGDIHGQDVMLEAALGYLRGVLNPEDQVVFLGDYIDRGPDSARVLHLLRSFKDERSGVVFLRGNHDDMLLQSFLGNVVMMGCWMQNGGKETLASYGWDKHADWRDLIEPAHLHFLSLTEFDREISGYHFVHACLPSPGTPDKEAESIKLWMRPPVVDERDYGSVMVFGHTIQKSGKPLVEWNRIGIDTGAFLPNGSLTIAVLAENAASGLMGYVQVDRDGNVDEFVHIPQRKAA